MILVGGFYLNDFLKRKAFIHLLNSAGYEYLEESEYEN